MTSSAGATVSGWSSSAAFVDYDHDGRLDLYVGRYSTGRGNRSRLPVGGRHRPRLLSSEAVCARFECVAPQQRRRHFRDVSAAAGIAAHPGKALGVAIHDSTATASSISSSPMIRCSSSFPEHGRGTFDEVALEAALRTTTMGRALPGWAPISRTTTTMVCRTYS